MKLLEKEKVVAPRGHSGGGHVRVARAIAAPQPVVTLRTEVVPRRATKRRSASLVEFCNRVVAFSAIVGMTYVGSTLGGYAMLERARQTARHGAERASFARAEAREARASIEALTNPADLSAWASVHGFVAGPATGLRGGGLVATR